MQRRTTQDLDGGERLRILFRHLIVPTTTTPCEGRSAGHCLTGVAAAPAAAACNRRIGRPRPAVRRNYDRLPLMAGRDGDEGRPEAVRIGEAKPPVACPEAWPRGQKSSQVERRKATRFTPRARLPKGRRTKVLRLLALHPLALLARGKRSKPGAHRARGNDRAGPGFPHRYREGPVARVIRLDYHPPAQQKPIAKIQSSGRKLQ